MQMKKMQVKKRQLSVCLALCAVLAALTADARHLRQEGAAALSLCADAVIPALFPFMAVTGLLVSLGFGGLISPPLAGVMGPLFGLPGCAGSALALGLAGGYPIGAKSAGELYAAGQLTRQEAERLLTFCNNANPVFTVSVLGAGVFGSVRTGLWLWMIHVLSALLTGLMLCRRRGRRLRQAPLPAPADPPPLAGAVVEAVRSAAGGMLHICAFVTLFYILVSPLRALPPPWGALAVGTVELFSLTPLLTPDRAGLVIAAGCSGWGGLCVLCQTAACLSETDLSLGPCLAGKAVQGLLSALLAFLLASWLI